MKKPHSRKKGPGRRHVQGDSRKRTALNQYPGTHRERRERRPRHA